MRKLLKKQGFAVDVFVTGKWRFIGAALGDPGLGWQTAHREISYLPVRQPEDAMRGVKTNDAEPATGYFRR